MCRALAHINGIANGVPLLSFDFVVVVFSWFLICKLKALVTKQWKREEKQNKTQTIKECGGGGDIPATVNGSISRYSKTSEDTFVFVLYEKSTSIICCFFLSERESYDYLAIGDGEFQRTESTRCDANARCQFVISNSDNGLSQCKYN